VFSSTGSPHLSGARAARRAWASWRGVAARSRPTEHYLSAKCGAAAILNGGGGGEDIAKSSASHPTPSPRLKRAH